MNRGLGYNLHVPDNWGEPHTSVTALRTCVCMSACLLACLLVAIYRKFKLNERMFKFAHVLKQIHVQ